MLKTEATERPMLHPLHAVLLAYPIALFTAGLASDLAYLRTAEIQWSNFSSWLIAGALVMGGLVLAWAIIGFVFPGRASRMMAGRYCALIVLMWGSGLINAFQHSRDGWSSVGPTGIILSMISTVAALCAGFIGFSRRGSPRTRA